MKHRIQEKVGIVEGAAEIMMLEHGGKFRVKMFDVTHHKADAESVAVKHIAAECDFSVLPLQRVSLFSMSSSIKLHADLLLTIPSQGKHLR